MNQLDLFKGKWQRGVRPPDPLEREIHITLVRIFRASKLPGWGMLHPANGELRTKATGALLKDMGVMAGASDLFVFGPNKFFGALEVKRRGGTMSIEQAAFQLWIETLGFKSACVDSVKEGVAVLKKWGAVRVSL